MRKTSIMMCCGAALVLSAAGCDRNRTDDTLVDEDRPAVIDPATRPMDEAPAPGTTMAGDASMLSVATGSDGDYVTDNQGRAVYMLEGDSDGSKCTGDCLEAWPPVQTEGQAGTAGTTGATGTPGATNTPGTTGATMGELRMDMVGTLARADGTTQVTYNAHPLYRFAKDTGRGTTAGHEVDDQWGEWYLVKPDGDAIDDD